MEYYVGVAIGVILTLICVAIDRYLFSPFTERTQERARRERYFKDAARQAAIEADTDV